MRLGIYTSSDSTDRGVFAMASSSGATFTVESCVRGYTATFPFVVAFLLVLDKSYFAQSFQGARVSSSVLSLSAIMASALPRTMAVFTTPPSFRMLST